MSQGLAAQQPVLDSVDQYVQSEMRRQHIPGMSVAVVQRGRVVVSRGYGLANVELQVSASDSTVYQSGSLGKQFTAAAVAMLAQQGRLNLDDRIARWFPEGAKVWKDVTVRRLLTHTAGIAEYTDSTFDYRKDYTEDQLVRFAASRPLDFPPGERWSYSNTGYLLLGALIHRVTGRFYGAVLHDQVFVPLGMRSTRIISEADIVPHRAAGYQLRRGQLQNQDWVAPSLNTTADGSLYFSILDLVQWATSLDQRHIPDSTVLAEAWSPARLNDGGLFPYGFGWDLTPQRGRPRIGHTGSWQGFKTALFRSPEYGLTVITLANLAEAHPGPIAEGIAGLFQSALTPPPRLATSIKGPAPPSPVPAVLRRLVQGNDSTLSAPGLERFLTAASRRDLEETIVSITSWKAVGCDPVASLHLAWLSSQVARSCYALGRGGNQRVVAYLYYTADWRLAYFEVSPY